MRCSALVEQEPAPLPEDAGSRPVSALVGALLEKDPSRRPPAAEVARLLRSAEEGGAEEITPLAPRAGNLRRR
jgi:hypothetical protein